MNKWIKLFEDFEDIQEAYEKLYGADTYLYLSVGSSTKIDDIDLIQKMAKDYKETYIKNKEWGGGPVNKEWRERWNKYFPEGLSGKIYKPNIILEIDLQQYGKLKVGFSLNHGKCNLFGYKDLNEESFDNKKDYFDFVLLLRDKFYEKSLYLDTVELRYNLNVINLNGGDLNIPYIGSEY